MEVEKIMKVSRFKVVVSVLLVAMVATACNIAFVFKDIWWLQGLLERMYRDAAHAHSGLIWLGIELTEAALDQKLTHLKILVVAMAVLVISLMISIKLKHSARKRTNVEGEVKNKNG